MVDTPRTLAEVKALLADNTTGQISPQDMRDLVESIVDPVPGGGFDGTIAANYPASDVVAMAFDGGTHSIASGTWWNPSFSDEAEYANHHTHDPDELIQGSGFDWDGFIMPATSYVRLPQGWWLIHLLTKWDISSLDGDRRAGFWFDYRFEVDPVMGTPFNFWGITTVSYRDTATGIAGIDGFQHSTTMLPVTSAVLAETDAFSAAGQGAIVAPYFQQYSDGPVGVTGAWFVGLRLGNVA